MSTSTPPLRLLVLALVVLAACSDDGAGGEVPTTTTASVGPTAPAADAEIDESEVGLSRTSWRLVALVDLDGARTPAEGEVPAVVSFDEGQVEGYDGVNTATGNYELAGDELRIDLEEVSEFEPSPSPRAEQFFFDLLVRVERAEMAGGDLVLHHRGGELRLEPVGGGTVG